MDHRTGTIKLTEHTTPEPPVEPIELGLSHRCFALGCELSIKQRQNDSQRHDLEGIGHITAGQHAALRQIICSLDEALPQRLCRGEVVLQREVQNVFVLTAGMPGASSHVQGDGLEPLSSLDPVEVGVLAQLCRGVFPILNQFEIWVLGGKHRGE